MGPQPTSPGARRFGFHEMVPGTMGDDGQALGMGCVYPPAVRTIANQLEAAGKTWKG